MCCTVYWNPLLQYCGWLLIAFRSVTMAPSSDALFLTDILSTDIATERAALLLCVREFWCSNLGHETAYPG
jgi:hypothetical protein